MARKKRDRMILPKQHTRHGRTGYKGDVVVYGPEGVIPEPEPEPEVDGTSLDEEDGDEEKERKTAEDKSRSASGSNAAPRRGPGGRFLPRG